MVPSFLRIVLFPIFLAVPGVILYFIIKLAVKNAIKELKEDKTL
jgi:phage shock protein PspC (stress-responsive transcriptional regulator)